MHAGRTMAGVVVAVAGEAVVVKKTEEARLAALRRRCNPRVTAAAAISLAAPGFLSLPPTKIPAGALATRTGAQCLFWPGLIVVGPLSSAHNVRQPASRRHLGQTPPLVENIDKRLEALGGQGSEMVQTVTGLRVSFAT